MVVCHNCRKRGHLQKACRGKGRQAGAQADSKPRSVRCVSEEAGKGEIEEFPILHVRVHQKMPPYKVVVEADGQALELEVDTDPPSP